MRLSIDHQTGFGTRPRVKSSYNEARMTPRRPTTRRCGAAGSTSNLQRGASATPTTGAPCHHFEVHEPHHRLTVHAQSVVETHGDDLAWDVDRRVAPNDLGWPALQDRAVVDKMAEFLTVNERTQPPRNCPAWPR